MKCLSFSLPKYLPAKIVQPGRLILLVASLCLAACGGTLQASVEIMQPTPTSEWAYVSWTETPDYVFADNISLLGYRISSPHVAPGGDLELSLHWKVEAVPPYPYVVSLRLIGDPDAPPVWGHSDNLVRWIKGYQVSQHFLHFSSQIQTGEYDLEIEMYHPENGLRAPLVGPNGLLPNNRATLLTLELVGDPLYEATPQSFEIVPITTRVITATNPTE